MRCVICNKYQSDFGVCLTCIANHEYVKAFLNLRERAEDREKMFNDAQAKLAKRCDCMWENGVLFECEHHLAQTEKIAQLESLIVANRHCNGGERKDHECADCPFLGRNCEVAHGLPEDESLTEERGEISPSVIAQYTALAKEVNVDNGASDWEKGINL